MFTVYLCRTIKQRTHSHFLLPFIRRSVAAQHGLLHPPYSYSTYSFFQAFCRTLTSRYRKLDHGHFSTLQPSHVHNFYETMNFAQQAEFADENTKSGVTKIVKLLRGNFDSERGESTDLLDGSGVKPAEDLIFSVIWALRDEWKLAFFVFKWGQKWRCNDENAWSLMIWVLGNHKKFSNAWCLIRDLYNSSMDTRRPMLIMIDRYAAANEPSEAIRTFQIMEKFKLSPDQKAFNTLLYTLCEHGNVEEAEEFMFLNAKLFPLGIEGFNIVLNGWCNIFVDIFEAKRIWKEMDKCRIIPDEISYTHMISCFSKVNNLFDSLRLYDEMKKKGWRPNQGIYNSLVHVLAHENCHDEALRILDKMKETGLRPDSSTYNFLIRPLCKAGKLEDARRMLSKMLEENINPTIDTYHTFLECTDITFEESLELLERMWKSGNGPNRDSFLMLFGKLFELGQVKSALEVWVKMKEYEVSPDSAHFVTMVEGLVKHGLTSKARELHTEMISLAITEDPKLTKLLKDTAPNDKHRKMKKTGMRKSEYDNRGARTHHGKKWFRGKRSRT